MASLLNVYDNNEDDFKEKKPVRNKVQSESRFAPIKEESVQSTLKKDSDSSRKQTYKNDNKVFDKDEFTRSAKTLFREDVDISNYSPRLRNIVVKPVDKNIEDFVSSFSRENKGNGGSSITISQLVHTILDVVYYDMELSPNGFDSVEDLRTFLQEKMK